MMNLTRIKKIKLLKNYKKLIKEHIKIYTFKKNLRIKLRTIKYINNSLFNFNN